jgi:hypothetical protein
MSLCDWNMGRRILSLASYNFCAMKAIPHVQSTTKRRFSMADRRERQARSSSALLNMMLESFSATKAQKSYALESDSAMDASDSHAHGFHSST